MHKAKIKKSVGFEFVQKGNYPSFIKEHDFFKQVNTGSPDNKIYPFLGLANCIEDCEYINADIDSYAATAMSEMSYCVSNGQHNQTIELSKLIFAFVRVLTSSYGKNIVRGPDGKAELRLHEDMVIDGKVVYKKGKSLFKIYTAIHEMGKGNGYITALDSIQAVKNFNSINVPSAGMKVAFSSTGEEGFWDIATISMRGIASCQAWDKPQSRALISALSSRFTGVVFITTNDPFNAYGSRMIRRAIVRYCIHKETRIPALLLDNIYPSWDAGSMNLFKSFLKKKTGMTILAPGCPENNANRSKYFIPHEKTWKNFPLAQGEDFYMDSPVTYKRDLPANSANMQDMMNADSQINTLVRNWVRNYPSEGFESGDGAYARKHLIYYFDDYSLNFLSYCTGAIIRRGLTQAEFNRKALRETLTGFNHWFKIKVETGYIYSHQRNIFWQKMKDEFKSFLRKIIVEEYRKQLI